MKSAPKYPISLMDKGFSLIELIIVILVVGILVMTLLPKFLSTTQISAVVAAELAAAEIRAAQGKAMFSGNPQTIVFSGSDYTIDGQTKQLPGDSVATSYTVVFNTFGEPSFDGGDSLQISSGETTRTITISSLTGKVTIE